MSNLGLTGESSGLINKLINDQQRKTRTTEHGQCSATRRDKLRMGTDSRRWNGCLMKPSVFIREILGSSFLNDLRPARCRKAFALLIWLDHSSGSLHKMKATGATE